MGITWKALFAFSMAIHVWEVEILTHCNNHAVVTIWEPGYLCKGNQGLDLLFYCAARYNINICDWPAKIGNIYTQNLALFLNFNLQYLLKDKCYDNEVLMSYSQINKKVKQCTAHDYLKHKPRKALFLDMCNLCRYAWFSQAQSHMYCRYCR